MARPSFPSNRRVGSGGFPRPNTFGGGGSSRPVKAGNLQQPGAVAFPRQTGNGETRRPFNFGNLPRPNSIGGAGRPLGSGQTASGVRPTCIRAPCPSGFGASGQRGNGNARPFNAANLPKPNSLGGTRVSGNGGTRRPFNLANLPKPDSFGGTHLSSSGGSAHAFNAANLPKPNTLGAAHQGAPGTGQAASAALHGNFHALAATHDPKGGGVVGAAKKEGAAQQKLDEANANLKTAEKKTADDTKNAASKAAGLNAANAVFNAATTKLEVDKASQKPAALIAVDQANQAKAGAALTAASVASLQANQKVAADKKAAATDKKVAAADKKDLQQAKQTLSDKQKIAQQKNEIGKLKTQQQSADNSNNPGSDNGQGSNNQSSDNGQSSSGDGGGSQAASSNSGGAGSGGSGGNSVVNSATTAAATTPAVVGAAAAGATPGVLPPVTDPGMPPPPPPAASPGVVNPDQTAAVNPTFVMVGFQKDVSNDDVTAFLKAYDASIIEGPNNDGLYKIQLTSSVPLDQMQQLLDSMKSQQNVVLSAVAE